MAKLNIKLIKWRRVTLWAAVCTITFIACSKLVSLGRRDFELNQFWLQKNELRSGNISSEIVVDYTRSLFSLGYKLAHAALSADETKLPDPYNPDEMLTYLFKNFPSYAVVYPTETYYYYRFTLAGQPISGNIRLLDAHLGKVHIGYFFSKDPQGGAFSKTFDVTNGLNVKDQSNREANFYRVSYGNQTVVFKLPNNQSQGALPKMNEDERLVSWIQDESGVRFYLLFNQKTSAFYYLLDEHHAAPEDIEILESNPELLLGKRSSFIFYSDLAYNRKILVGVSLREVYENSYFDGPFDQVPPRLQLRDMLYRAYPYTALRGGLDEHGNFNKIAQTRVAISPYFQYDTIPNLVQQLSRCDRAEERSILWSCLTYEWKRSFHLTLQGNPGQHYIFTSQGWPANHQAHMSTSWPPQHLKESSRLWARDHDGKLSSAH
jgi:hypothetical protein